MVFVFCTKIMVAILFNVQKYVLLRMIGDTKVTRSIYFLKYLLTDKKLVLLYC